MPRPFCFFGAMLAMTISRRIAFGNLIINSGFESGDSGFTSEFTSAPADGDPSDDLVPPDVYKVLTDPSDANASAESYGDHTTGSGLMMAVNGTETAAGQLVWSQTVSVSTNTTYDFSMWVSTWSMFGPSSLDVLFNGDLALSFLSPGTAAEWANETTTWDSGMATSLTIDI